MRTGDEKKRKEKKRKDRVFLVRTGDEAVEFCLINDIDWISFVQAFVRLRLLRRIGDLISQSDFELFFCPSFCSSDSRYA